MEIKDTKEIVRGYRAHNRIFEDVRNAKTRAERKKFEFTKWVALDDTLLEEILEILNKANIKFPETDIGYYQLVREELKKLLKVGIKME